MRGLNQSLTDINFIVNREVRVIPLDWQHSKDDQGRPIPLFLEDMPAVAHLPADRLGLMVYETTSEGTPCSPVFANTARGREDLLDYCIKHVSLFADQLGTRADWEPIIIRDEPIAASAEAFLS
jgi:hypothetical protein